MFYSWKKIKILLYLLFSLSIAGYSLDRMINWLWSSLAGFFPSPWQLIYAFIGLIIGLFIVVKIVYRIDKSNGKVKRSIKLLE